MHIPGSRHEPRERALAHHDIACAQQSGQHFPHRPALSQLEFSFLKLVGDNVKEAGDGIAQVLCKQKGL